MVQPTSGKSILRTPHKRKKLGHLDNTTGSEEIEEEEKEWGGGGGTKDSTDDVQITGKDLHPTPTSTWYFQAPF